MSVGNKTGAAWLRDAWREGKYKRGRCCLGRRDPAIWEYARRLLTQYFPHPPSRLPPHRR